jgi:DNA invertase Pin-like site-specific DNA recombinase
MALIGYARVSTRGQKDDSQVDELKAAGCVKIFIDHGVTGKLAARPELDACLAYLRDGEDTLVITRLARAMRNLRHLLELADTLRERKLDLKVLKQGIDTSTPTGRLAFHMLAAVDEFQREIIVEGTLEGLEAARARGRKGGRPAKLTDAQVKVAKGLVDAKELTVGEIAAMFNVSRPTLYRYLEQPAA